MMPSELNRAALRAARPVNTRITRLNSSLSALEAEELVDKTILSWQEQGVEPIDVWFLLRPGKIPGGWGELRWFMVGWVRAASAVQLRHIAQVLNILPAPL